MILPDVLKPGLNVVFCGSAAGNTSAQRGAYYAGPDNKFWATLYKIGLTPRQLEPHEFAMLLDFGIGLTDMVKDQKGNDSQIKRTASDRDILKEKMLRYQPKILAFNSMGSAAHFLKRTVPCGQLIESIGATRLFVLPSTSRTAHWNWNLAYWQDLAAAVKQLTDVH